MTGPIKRALDRQRAIDAAREAVIAAARTYASPFLYAGTGDASVASEKLVDAVENLDRLEATDAGTD